jgi:hypothetical protein
MLASVNMPQHLLETLQRSKAMHNVIEFALDFVLDALVYSSHLVNKYVNIYL